MTDEQTALELCNEYGPRNPGMAAAIVRALQQARTPPPGHIIDDQGVVRRVAARGVYGQWPSDEVLAADTSRCTEVLWIEAADEAKEAK